MVVLLTGTVLWIKLLQKIILRKYVEKKLKSKGIRKTVSTINRISRIPLHRARVSLEKADSDELSRTGRESYPHLEERFSSVPNLSEDDKDLVNYGCWSQQFLVFLHPKVATL